MNKRVLTSFEENPVEMVVGLVTLVGGLALTSIDGWPRIVGAVLTAVASYLISWTMAAVKARADARFELQNRMSQVGTHLATTSSRIVEAIRAGESGESESATAYARVRDGAASLFGLVQQIEEESGRAVSSKAVIQNAEKLMDLSTRLRVILAEVDPDDAEELHEVQTELEAVAEELSERPLAKPTVDARCPECGRSVKFPLGERKGDSAMPTCGSCGSRFHAHRQSDRGEVFTRVPGSQHSPVASRRLVALRELAVDCPNCRNRISLRVARNEEGLKVRFCMNCFRRLEIDPVEATVVRDQEARVEDSARVENQGNRFLLTCPECGRDAFSFYQYDDTVYGVCYRCEPAKLLRANLELASDVDVDVDVDMQKVSFEVDRLKKLSREAAVNYLRGLSGRHPNNSELHQVLGAALRKWAVQIKGRGQEAEANRLLSEAIAAHNKSLELEAGSTTAGSKASVYYALGRAYFELGKPDEARTSFENALTVDPQHVKAGEFLTKIAEEQALASGPGTKAEHAGKNR